MPLPFWSADLFTILSIEKITWLSNGQGERMGSCTNRWKDGAREEPCARNSKASPGGTSLWRNAQWAFIPHKPCVHVLFHMSISLRHFKDRLYFSILWDLNMQLAVALRMRWSDTVPAIAVVFQRSSMFPWLTCVSDIAMSPKVG